MLYCLRDNDHDDLNAKNYPIQENAMLQEITRENVSQIKNPVFRDYANMYLDIYDGFVEEVEKFGQEFDTFIFLNMPQSLEKDYFFCKISFSLFPV